MRDIAVSILLFLSGIIYASAQPGLPDAIFDLPKTNYKLIAQQTIYAKDTIIKRDFDNDGVEESIIVGRNHPNGFMIVGIQNHYGYNLCPVLSDIDMPPCDEFGDLSAGFYVQISWIDLDNDNKEELIVSVGDMSITSFTSIYRIRESNTLPFIKVCQINGQGHLYLTDNKDIIVPIGFQGLANVYRMQDGRIKVIN